MLQHTRAPLDWLLTPDDQNPGVRYFALRDLLNRPPDAPDCTAAQAEVMRTGPIPAILDAQYPAGYWVKPGPGYSPKYRATVWQVMFLAQLGAEGQAQRDERIRRAVDYVLDQHQTEDGLISYNGRPAGAIHCLWGNLTRAILDLEGSTYTPDERMKRSIEQLARSVTGDEYASYRRSGIRGPGFRCAANDGLPCAWGAIRVLWALNRALPAWKAADDDATLIESAIEVCVHFLLQYDVRKADYPYRERISSSWFKFGYPLGYVTDVLLNLEVLLAAGEAGNPRLQAAMDWVCSKQDAQGHWWMEYSYNGKMWCDVEKKGAPSKWVTLRAMRVLQMWETGTAIRCDALIKCVAPERTSGR